MNAIALADAGTCPVRPLDALVADVADVQLLKVDAEGHGIPVLKGASEILGRSRPVVAVEVHPEPVERFVELLGTYGYRMEGEFNATPTYVFRVPDA